MLHRDQGCRTGSGTYAQQLLAAIQGLFADVDWKGIGFRKDCTWTTRGLVAAALLWAWSSKDTLGKRFIQARRTAHGLARSCAPAKSSYQAFISLLVRWISQLRDRLIVAFQSLMERTFPK